jgi:hypothetical protein
MSKHTIQINREIECEDNTCGDCQFYDRSFVTCTEFDTILPSNGGRCDECLKADVTPSLWNRFLTAFKSAPVQTGCNHPAEPLLKEWLTKDDNSSFVFSYMNNMLTNGKSGDVLSLLRLVTRVMDKPNPHDAVDLIERCLRKSLVFQHEAVLACEKWGSKELIKHLERNIQYLDAPWLKNYAENVVAYWKSKPTE